MTNYAGILFSLAAMIFLPAAALLERRARRRQTVRAAKKRRRYATIRAEYRGIAGIVRNRRNP